jgi:hypothetical protein
MKAMPTLEGGLRLDAESARDWAMLRQILADAKGRGLDLASRLGGLIHEDAGAQDWEEFVVPDLREAFQDELAQVAAAIESAMHLASSGPGPLWIQVADAYPWYSALNQARLALEEQFHFGAQDEIDPINLPPVRRSALMRSLLYLEIQSLLLAHVIRA